MKTIFYVAIAFVAIVSVALIWGVVETYRIEMDSYNQLMMSFYDDVFAYLLETNQTDLQFNYTPETPPFDLSEGML